MGAWGEHWQSNDDYYNNLDLLVTPIIKDLKTQLEHTREGKFFDGSGGSADVAYLATSGLRTHLVTVYTMLRHLPGLSLSNEELEVFADTIQLVNDNIDEAAVDWRDPDVFKDVARGELQRVTAWLHEFRPVGFLGDRLPEILKAVSK